MSDAVNKLTPEEMEARRQASRARAAAKRAEMLRAHVEKNWAENRVRKEAERTKAAEREAKKLETASIVWEVARLERRHKKAKKA